MRSLDKAASQLSEMMFGDGKIFIVSVLA